MMRILLLIVASITCSSVVRTQSLQWEKSAAPETLFLSIATIDGQTLLAGNNLPWGGRNENYRSADGGATWVPNGRRGVHDYYIEASGVIWMGTPAGVYRSDDTGESWNLVGLQSERCQVIIRGGNGQLYVGTHGQIVAGDGGLFQSLDEGQTWSRMEGDFADTVTDVHAFVITTDGFLFAGTNAGLYQLDEANLQWNPAGLQDGAIRTLLQHPDGSLFAGSWQRGIYRSVNQGATWAKVSERSINGPNDLTVDPAGMVYAATRDGVYQAPPVGLPWTVVSEGLPQDVVYALALSESGILWAATATGLYRTVAPVISAQERIAQPRATSRLDPNFPNPFQTTTSIPFSVAQAGPVELSVFDVLGRRITTLVSGSLRPGQYQVEWNSTGLAEGVYLYQLVTAGRRRVGRMLKQ